METLLLAVLLMMNADEGSRETLKNFLGFYKENKELIAMLAGQKAETAESDGAQEKNETPEAQTESRPREESGSPAILEEYLKRFSV